MREKLPSTEAIRESRFLRRWASGAMTMTVEEGVDRRAKRRDALEGVRIVLLSA